VRGPLLPKMRRTSIEMVGVIKFLEDPSPCDTPLTLGSPGL